MTLKISVLDYYRRRLPRETVRLLFDLWQGQSSATRAGEVSGVSRLTAMRHFRRFRYAAAETLSPEEIERCAEVDESYFGQEPRTPGEPKMRGRATTGKSIVVGAIDRDTKKAVVEIVPDVKRETLHGFVGRWIRKGARVITDGWRAYRKMRGYVHKAVNHSIGEFKRGRDLHTNSVENLWRQIKRRLHPYNGAYRRWTSRFQGFLFEGLFFFNVRSTAARCLALGVPPRA